MTEPTVDDPIVIVDRTPSEVAHDLSQRIDRNVSEIAVLSVLRRDAMRQMAETMTRRAIAAELGISAPRVTQIINGKAGS